MTWHMWLACFGACWAISLSPGAGAVTSMATGMRHGLARGGWNIAGLQLGLLLQMLVVAVGLDALLAGSATAFTAIKWFGVGYLVYLGVRQWRAAPEALVVSGDGSVTESRRALVGRGFLVNATNPKAVVFLLAVIPQFLDPASPLAVQYAIITATMCTVDVIVMTGYTGLASRVLALMRTPRQQRITNRTFAGLFVLAATVLASVRRAA